MMRNDVHFKIEKEPYVLIRIKRTTRTKLIKLKKGNPERVKTVDTYDDVINRLILNGR